MSANTNNNNKFLSFNFLFPFFLFICLLGFLLVFRTFSDVIHKRISYSYHMNNHIPIQTVFIGDSITASAGIWEFEIANPISSVNLGEASAPISIISWFSTKAVNLKPKYICVMAGTNDIAYDSNIDNSIGEYIQMLDFIRANNIKIVITSIPPYRDGSKNGNIEKINNAIRDYSCRYYNSVKYIDLWQTDLNDNGKANSNYYISDGIHFNSKAYKIWKSLVHSRISEFNLK